MPCSMKEVLSSTTTISSSPSANVDTMVGSTGHIMPSRSTRMPAAISSSWSRPRSLRPWRIES